MGEPEDTTTNVPSIVHEYHGGDWNNPGKVHDRKKSIFFNTMYLIFFLLLISVVTQTLRKRKPIQNLKNKINKKIKQLL